MYKMTVTIIIGSAGVQSSGTAGHEYNFVHLYFVNFYYCTRYKLLLVFVKYTKDKLIVILFILQRIFNKN